MKLWKSVEALKKDVIMLRRDLHMIPEDGFKEYKTSAYIEAYLKTLEIDHLKKVADTGWIALFKGNNPKRTLGFRADMDGLSVEEATGVEFKSIHDGYMHACGHDGHMAIALAFSKWVSDHKASLEDNVVVIYQPAEEGPGGAEIIVKEGVLEEFELDAIFALHLFPEIEEGVFGVKDGPIMAMPSEFDIDIIGKSAHGAKPHLGVDSIVIAANMLQDLQQIVSRKIDPVDNVVLTVGRIEGGERRNVIAGKTRLEGTIRGFRLGVFDVIEVEMLKLFKAYELQYGCQITYDFRRQYPPVINDDILTATFNKVNGENTILVKPQMLAEDFSYYNEVAPCLFFFLGTRNENKAYIYGLHHAKFDFYEPVLLNAVQAYLNLLNYYDSFYELAEV